MLNFNLIQLLLFLNKQHSLPVFKCKKMSKVSLEEKWEVDNYKEWTIGFCSISGVIRIIFNLLLQFTIKYFIKNYSNIKGTIHLFTLILIYKKFYFCLSSPVLLVVILSITFLSTFYYLSLFLFAFQGENPIYKPCTTVFKNPQYSGGNH